MHILICNERFLFRFGLDRALIILGMGMKESGHTISIMANKFDQDVVSTFATNIIKVPEKENDYLNSNEFTESWLRSNWHKIFQNSDKPDLVFVGGWPFFTAISFFRKSDIPVIFFDCGAVPTDGYAEGILVTQRKLRDLRKRYLKESTSIISISDFIADSQSKVDSYNKIPVNTVLLGADHMDMNIWQTQCSTSSENDLIQFQSQKNAGRKCILNLGRWETGCYKNSDAVFDVMRNILIKIQDCSLFIFSDPGSVQIPDDLKNIIYPIGFPGDAELKLLMEEADLGLSTSLWEGFNLPLAEMQWLNKPVLVFNEGAHPEVISDTWYLCKDNNEMAMKACEILEGKGLDIEARSQANKKFHAFFTWRRVITESEDIFKKAVQENIIAHNQNLLVIIDVTNASRDPANSGVIRITRRLCHEFQKYLNPIFVIWNPDSNSYVFPTKSEYAQLGAYNGPDLTDERMVSPPDDRIPLDRLFKNVQNKFKWLLFTETLNEVQARNIRRYARNYGIYLAAIFHDAIPVLHPELCKDTEIRDNHSDYMKGLAECDIVFPVSEFSANSLKDFWKFNNISGCKVFPNPNPGEFGGFKRSNVIKNPDPGNIRIVCVSTLEPRKNHKTLIQSCLLIQEEHPGLNWSLTLVGNRYAGAYEIAEYIQDVSKNTPRIQWVGIVDDTDLHYLYDNATFTVYPSIIEGFGMPILESIWHGKPVICSNQGVMSEIAAGGGCLTTNILDEKSLADAIYTLATDNELFFKLSEEALKRKVKTWDEYARQFISLFRTETDQQKILLRDKYSVVHSYPNNWEEIVYPGCICENWQMDHSERLALTALLLRHKPYCSIEIGTSRIGSLPLISPHSNLLFSVDMDPTIPQKFGFFKNTVFLTGSSAKFLPILLKELDNENIPVDFIFVGRDHSTEDITQDLNSILSYVPKKPLFVIMHDSFNPELRRGILSAEWNNCPYIQWLDIDFVPGRIVENGSSSQGEMRGGLALAYLTPETRDGPLHVNLSANLMYELIKNSLIKSENNTPSAGRL